MVGSSSPISYATAKLSYPIFDAEFDPYDRGYLVVAGGGGENKTGVPNRITLLDVSSRSSISQVAEIDLSTDEDSPQSIASLATKKGLMTFAGVSSCDADQKLGKNEHLRSYDIEFPVAKRVKRDQDNQKTESEEKLDGQITFAGSSSLFKPPTSKKSRVYQRLLRLSPIRSRELAAKRIGAIAAADAAENEIVVFDATTFLPRVSSILTRIKTSTETEDLDLFEHSQGKFGLVYCTKEDAMLYTITCDFSSKTSTTSDSQAIYSASPQGSSRPRLHSLRWISPKHLVLLQNFPQAKGAELLVLHLEHEKGSIVRRHLLPKSIGMGVRLDVCFLDADPATSERQIVIAVAGHNKSIHVFTCNHKPLQADPAQHISKIRSFTALDTSRQHPQSITKIVFSNFFAPVQPDKSNMSVASDTQYIYLASVSLGYTVSVEALALTSTPTSPASTQDVPLKQSKSPSVRWVLSTTQNELLQSWYALTIAGVIVVVAGILLQYYISSIMQVPPGGFIASTNSVLSQNPKISTSESIVPTAKIQETAQHHYFRIKDWFHLHGEQSESINTDQSVSRGPKKAIHVKPASDNPYSKEVAASLHEDENKLRESGARKFEELDRHEKEVWKDRLSAAGHWSAEEGETVLKGVFFSEFANVVGGAIRDAILEQ